MRVLSILQSNNEWSSAIIKNPFASEGGGGRRGEREEGEEGEVGGGEEEGRRGRWKEGGGVGEGSEY